MQSGAHVSVFVVLQLKTERVQETEAVSRFVSYAKEWRDDFLRLRDSNRVRPIDILARAANGEDQVAKACLLLGGFMLASHTF